uniref:Uncharacterized protein n=1 Tax=Caenorhabditis japonica TaxID=281687 RepID=A0A8R1IHA8_CAEJA
MGLIDVYQKTPSCAVFFKKRDANGSKIGQTLREFDVNWTLVNRQFNFIIFAKEIGLKIAEFGWMRLSNTPIEDSSHEDRLAGENFVIEKMEIKIFGDYVKIPEEKGDKKLIIE